VEYKKVRDHPITVVFDGWGGFNLSSTRTRHEGITVIYTAQGQQTADEWIAARVGGVQFGAVVTSDREIQRHAERAGLVAIPSREFERRMETALAGTTDGDIMDEEWEEEEFVQAKRKGSAWQLSKKEKKRRAILEKL
jgi:predicted RNA-binding protein with PIN domain